MHTQNARKAWFGWGIGLLMLVPGAPALAAGEATTRFQVYVPPNNDNNRRDSAMIVTAIDDGTIINVEDDDEDGDADDSASGIRLDSGQSWITYLREGDVNDDAGGKWDGDYFIVTSDKPVLLQLSTNSNWQHDWVPSTSRNMTGRRFVIYSPPTSGADNDINAYAYEDTTFELWDITDERHIGGGKTSIVSGAGRLILRQRLQIGEDLWHTHGVGMDLLDPGRTYAVRSTGRVSVQYGSTGATNTNYRARDGGGFIPAENGSTAGELFYFSIPHDFRREYEKELRVVGLDDGVQVRLAGWDGTQYKEFFADTIDELDRLDFVGRNDDEFRNYNLYRLTTKGGQVTAFEANWMETGSFGTSDMASALSSVDGRAVGERFIAYMGPPGAQTRVVGQQGYFSHLYVSAYGRDAELEVVDAATGGSIFSQELTVEAGRYADIRIDRDIYRAFDIEGRGFIPYLDLKVVNGTPVSVMDMNHNDNWMTYVSGVLPGDLGVEVNVPKSVVCGSNADIGFRVSHAEGGAGLENFELLATLPDGVRFLEPGEGELGEPLNELNDANGKTSLTWSGFSLEPGATQEQNIRVNVSCRSNVDESRVEMGSVLEVNATCRAREGEQARAVSSVGAAGVADEESTIVTSLAAGPGDASVRLNWTTGPERGNRGFRIFRAKKEDEVPTEIPGVFIESKGESESGFSYEFVDTDVCNGCGTYYYRVQSAEVDGDTSTLGPVSAKPKAKIIGFTFTGDVDVDFFQRGKMFADPGGSGRGGDVVVPEGIGKSGNDFRRIALNYEPASDTLYVGVQGPGKFGDADDDGNPDGTSPALAALGGVDRANWAEDESFALVFDVNGDNVPDYVCGTPYGTTLDTFRVTHWADGLPLSLAPLAFGQVVDGIGVSPPAPSGRGWRDLEFSISNFSALLGGPPNRDTPLAFHAYVGAQSDAGIGEDYVPGANEFWPITIGEIDDNRNHYGRKLAGHGEFAIFGNYFSGTPNYEFLPLGFDLAGERVLEPPLAPGTPVNTSPIFFGSGEPTELVAVTNANDFPLNPEQTSVISTQIFSTEGEFGQETVIYERQEHRVPENAENGIPLENVDFQSFRVVNLECPHRVYATQEAPLGEQFGSRTIGFEDGSTLTREAGAMPIVLVHLVFGNFDRAGEFRATHRFVPEDFLEEWSDPGDLAKGFMREAGIDAEIYSRDFDEEDGILTVVPGDLVLEAGKWVVNMYFWSYVNAGVSETRVRFVPTEGCEQ